MGNDERRPGRSAILGNPEDPLLRPGTRKGWQGSKFGDGVKRKGSPKDYCGIRIGPVSKRQNETDLRRNGPGRISKVSEDIQRRTIPSISAKTAMGPRDRPTSGSPKYNQLQNLPHHAVRKGGVKQIRQRATSQRVHPTIKITLFLSVLLHKEERWKTTTGSRLPKTKRPDSQKPVPLATHPGADRSSTTRPKIHQIGHMMGIQQRPYQRRRRMEGSLQNQFRPLRAMRHVLRANQLPKYIPDHDGHHFPRVSINRRGHSLYGRHPYRDP